MKTSKIGLYLISFYLIFVSYIWLYALVCKEGFCGLIVSAGMIPWIYFSWFNLEWSEHGFPENPGYYFVFFILNILLLYLIGCFEDFILRKKANNNAFEIAFLTITILFFIIIQLKFFQHLITYYK